MKRIFVAVLVAICSWTAHAAAPTPQSIELLLSLLQADKVMDGVKPQIQALMKNSMDQALKGSKPGVEEQKVLDAYVARSAQIISESVTAEGIKSLQVQLYAKYFTQEEVDGIIAFYQSPVGKSMLSKTPQIMQSVIAAMPALMAPMMERLRASAEQMVNELGALQKKAPKASS